MIQIKKPARPIILIGGKAGTDKLAQSTVDIKKLYLRRKKGFDSGKYVFVFDTSIYGHSTIKDLLLLAQHSKCAFCESKIAHVQYGDIEHFRPKAGYKQNDKDTLNRPGYYWLSYDWENLYYTCQICNQQYKKNLFPIRNTNRRAHNHDDNCLKEKPFYPDPGKENPRHLIGFRGPNIYGKDKNNRGKKAIKELGLERSDFGDLTEVRRDILRPILITYKVSKLSGPKKGVTQADINEAKLFMEHCRSKKHQFSSMIRDNCPR